jgi:hypothetical protein
MNTLKTLLITKLWPLFAGFALASAVMMLFEYTNSFFFPLPENLDWYDTAAVQAFTASLPYTAFILVYLGWCAGAFLGSYIITNMTREITYSLSLTLGIILAILGLLNNTMLGHPLWFTVLAIPQFIICTYLGHRIARA